MKRCSYIIILLAVCMPFLSFAEEKKSPAGAGKKKAPMTYEAFMKKELKKTEGSFTVYQEDKKCYLEIPATAIGKDLLVSGVVKRGVAKGAVAAVTNMLKFDLGKNDQLEVKQQICSDRAEGLLAPAVKAASLQPVSFAYPVAAYGKGKQSYIIDITSDVNGNGKLFSLTGLRVSSPAADRTVLDSVQVIANGVKFMALYSQSQHVPGMLGRPGIDQHHTIAMEWSVQQLPDRKVTEREADARVGYTLLGYNDYDENPYGVVRKSIIKRWNLEVKPEDVEKYKRGELVEPANPINVYFDKSFNAALREAGARGVAEWNRCFEQAGFKNVLRVQPGEPEVAVAYHQIVYSFVFTDPSMTVVSDPITGEILSGSVSVSCKIWKDEPNFLTMPLGGYEPKVFTDSLATVYAEYYRYCTSNTLGQVLGLMPNLAGSMAFTTAQLRDAAWVRENGISASVTDGCIVNFAAQPGDGMTLRELFSKASVYDRWAIEWGYRQFPGADAKAEKAALQSIAERAKNNPALYYGSVNRKGFRVNPTDLGQDKLQTAALGLENLKRLAPKLEEIADELDQNDLWDEYANLVKDFRNQYAAYVQVVSDYYTGIVTPEPIIAGYNEERWSYLPKAEVEKAARFVKKYILAGAPAWMEFPQIEKVNGAKAYGSIVSSLMNLSKNMLDKETMSRMMEAQEKMGNKVYTLNDLFAMIERDVFLNYSASKAVDAFHSRVQYNYMKNLVRTCLMLNVTENANDFSYYLLDKAQVMLKKLEHLGRTHTDPTSRQHYRGISLVMKSILTTDVDKQSSLMMAGVKSKK